MHNDFKLRLLPYDLFFGEIPDWRRGTALAFFNFFLLICAVIVLLGQFQWSICLKS